MSLLIFCWEFRCFDIVVLSKAQIAGGCKFNDLFLVRLPTAGSSKMVSVDQGADSRYSLAR